MTTVRAALTQVRWTGDKESMIDVHEKHLRDAADQGAKLVCFQELFYGPYFCQVQDAAYYAYAESVPGPTVERFSALAAELGTVVVLPVYEEEQPGVLYNTAAVIDADGRYLGKYRKTHIPHVRGFWEKFYFRPGNLGYPVFDTAVGRVGVEHPRDDDFYGTSYFLDPEGAFVGDPADDHEEELIVRDLDLDLLRVVRDRWQFYRDRRPDAYDDLTRP
jgi:predicted amidohydrolase